MLLWTAVDGGGCVSREECIGVVAVGALGPRCRGPRFRWQALDLIAKERRAAAVGGRQVGKAPDFGSGIRRFESFPPS